MKKFIHFENVMQTKTTKTSSGSLNLTQLWILWNNGNKNISSLEHWITIQPTWVLFAAKPVLLSSLSTLLPLVCSPNPLYHVYTSAQNHLNLSIAHIIFVKDYIYRPNSLQNTVNKQQAKECRGKPWGHVAFVHA